MIGLSFHLENVKCWLLNVIHGSKLTDVFQPVVVFNFDNNPLDARPVAMDDNARLHRSKAVTAYR
jgi:hypothetical protein